MGNSIHFALLQRDQAGLTADQVKRAFKTFNNLTDADAVRLAVGARGILMRHLGQDTARALQLALQAEGVGVMVVAENTLPKLPEGLALHRLELWPQSLTIYDPLGRPTAVAWQEITLVAAGAAQCFDINKTQTDHLRLQLSPATVVRPKKTSDAGHQIKSDSELLLEILLAPGETRYQIDAAQFRFKYVIDRPGLSLEEKFIWLTREICRQATQAALNAGARQLLGGQETVPNYLNRQALADEMIWLLWRNAQHKRLHAS
jgi:hypothetical protein